MYTLVQKWPKRLIILCLQAKNGCGLRRNIPPLWLVTSERIIFEWKISKGSGDDLSGPAKGFCQYCQFLAKIYPSLKTRPKFRYTASKFCRWQPKLLHMNDFFNRIDQSRISKYNLYSSTLFYTDVSISSALRGNAFSLLPEVLVRRSSRRGKRA